MSDEIHQDISGTAFVVNYSRSKRVDISKDKYAHLWVTQQSIKLWNDLTKYVYSNDDINLSLRNRFYLDHLSTFNKDNKDAVSVILASGFTNYPFLLPKEYRFLETDLPNIIEYKESQVLKWMKENTLPERDIKFIPANLTNKNDQIKLKEILKNEIGNRPSIITMEGLAYYLSKSVLNELFEIFSDIQQPGSQIAFEFWKPDTMNYPVMKKLKNYLNAKFGYTEMNWFLFDERYIHSIPGYHEIEHTEIALLEEKYSDTKKLRGEDNKIPAYFTVLAHR